MFADARESPLPVTITPLILCGGSGTRLWPLSNEVTPKQLLSLNGSDTLLQATVRRVSSDLFGPPVIVTSESFGQVAAEQLARMNVQPDKLLLERVARNTGPAIGAAAFSMLLEGGDSLLLAMPSDHVIADEMAFLEAIGIAIPAAQSGQIVTFGIRPQRMETGYGYIEVGRSSADPIRPVIRFTEKPDETTAAEYLQSGRHFWNAGVFLFSASTIIRELRQHAPLVAAACEAAVDNAVTDGKFVHLTQQAFVSLPSISIDYAVLERSNRVSMVAAEIGWSDIGSWEALWDVSDKDPDGNVAFGNVLLIDSRGCFVRNDLDNPLAVVDATEMVVVVTAAGSIIIPRHSSQKTKLVAEALRTMNTP